MRRTDWVTTTSFKTSFIIASIPSFRAYLDASRHLVATGPDRAIDWRILRVQLREAPEESVGLEEADDGI